MENLILLEVAAIKFLGKFKHWKNIDRTFKNWFLWKNKHSIFKKMRFLDLKKVWEDPFWGQKKQHFWF